ncbi:MAG: hypothetical protein P1U32_04720 [Legionellaceae bacterium]|nr:hypothetical protein [Legionellaceae bacterium]
MKLRESGFSLTEILVCFLMSVALISILVMHVLSVSRQYQHTQTVLDEAIELQWVFDVIRARVHHAGFTPCVGLEHLKTVDTRERPEALKAIEVVNQKLLIRKMDEAIFGLVHILAPDTLRLEDVHLQAENAILIADCMHAEVHDIDSVRATHAGDVLTLKKPLVFAYTSEVYVGPWVSQAFFFRSPKGLFIETQRVNWLAAAQSVAFKLMEHKRYITLEMSLVSTLGKRYTLEARTRM